MKAFGAILILITILLTNSVFMFSASAAPPTIQRPMEIIEATTDGWSPATVDPAACYDSASSELIQNVYDTLVIFDGERLDRYLPQLATEWSIENITGTTSPDGLPWYYRYTFKIRQGVPFHNSEFGDVMPADVEYCIERAMVMDCAGGPQWMFYEPLLNGASATFVNQNTYDPTNNLTDRDFVGRCIDHAVESNATHVWFNLAFPGAYSPFLQILTQPWSSIYSKAWAISLGRATNWNGNWTNWFSAWNPSIPPFDDPSPVMMGTGPFTFANLDLTLMYWDVNRFAQYWRGWPLDWPASGYSKPAGYINHYKVSWAWNWPTRSTMFLNGDVDYCAVPRQNIGQVLGQPGIRRISPLPNLSCDALFFNFNIDPSTPYGLVFDYGVLNETGVPRNFFNDTDVRKAFAHLIDFQSFINQAYLGQAIQPTTAIITGLPYYDPTIPKWNYNPANATLHFQQAWGGQLWNTGFNLALAYNTGNLARQALMTALKTNIESLNPKFHVTVFSLPWSQYIGARQSGQLATLTLGWLADYPDPHNFAYGFYYTIGYFAYLSRYSDPVLDALIDQGIRTPDGPARAQIYHDIQQRVIDTCPSVALDQSVSSHFERDWMCGWEYSGIIVSVSYGNANNYPAYCWKWYYVPQALQDTAATSNLGADVNYDGKVDMKDIAAIAPRFRALSWPPTDSRWGFRCDFNTDGKIDGRDFGYVARYFAQRSPVWAPTP